MVGVFLCLSGFVVAHYRSDKSAPKTSKSGFWLTVSGLVLLFLASTPFISGVFHAFERIDNRDTLHEYYPVVQEAFIFGILFFLITVLLYILLRRHQRILSHAYLGFGIVILTMLGYIFLSSPQYSWMAVKPDSLRVGFTVLAGGSYKVEDYWSGGSTFKELKKRAGLSKVQQDSTALLKKQVQEYHRCSDYYTLSHSQMLDYNGRHAILLESTEKSDDTKTCYFYLAEFYASYNQIAKVDNLFPIIKDKFKDDTDFIDKFTKFYQDLQNKRDERISSLKAERMASDETCSIELARLYVEVKKNDLVVWAVNGCDTYYQLPFYEEIGRVDLVELVRQNDLKECKIKVAEKDKLGFGECCWYYSALIDFYKKNEMVAEAENLYLEFIHPGCFSSEYDVDDIKGYAEFLDKYYEPAIAEQHFKDMIQSKEATSPKLNSEVMAEFYHTLAELFQKHHKTGEATEATKKAHALNPDRY